MRSCCLAAVLWSVISPVLVAQPQPTGNPVSITTPDSLGLHAEWFESLSPEPAGLLVLLPMRGQTLDSYRSFINRVREYFEADTTRPSIPLPHMLAVDLRGHGASRTRVKDTLDFRSMGRAEYAMMPSDVASLIAHVYAEHGDRLDTTRLIVVGASIGANTALLLTGLLPRVTHVVALSPGSDYHGLRPADAFRNFKGEVLFVSSRGDTYSFETCQMLATSKNTGWLVKGYPGSQHGTDLLYADERVIPDVLTWLFAVRMSAATEDSLKAQEPDFVSDSSSGN
ncbi:MAG: alpha/beta fold hydrolase [candidate division Zixibacteria bacterium]|nr:alpha/beta fold hydrolase [candidate division Zixibacteria bacterium]